MKNKGNVQVLSGSASPHDYKIEKDMVLIGRSHSSDIVVNDKKASRNHVRILYNNGSYLIEDLNSRNGTMVNGKKVSGRSSLYPGDMIKIGNCELTLNAELKEESKILSMSKPLLVTIIMIAVAILAVTIPTVLLTGREKYKTVDRFFGGEKVYSYSIPENYNSTYDYEIEAEYFYNSNKTKLGSFVIEWTGEKVTSSDLMMYAGDYYDGYEYDDQYTGQYVRLERKTNEWFYNNSKVNGYILEYEGATSIGNMAGIYFWDSKSTLIYIVHMSISEVDEYVCFLTIFDTEFDSSRDINMINSFIDSIDIIENQ